MEPPDTNADVQAIRASLDDFREAANAGDIEGVLAHLSEDMELIAPGQEPVRGTAAHEAFRSFFETGKVSVSHDNSEVVAGGNVGFVRYSYDFTLDPHGGGNPMAMQGHGVRIFRKEADGSWRQTKDIYTVVPPPSERG